MHRLHRGVYSIVPPKLLNAEGHWLAAVLACGEGAVLSHRSAAALWGMRPQSSGPIEVTVPSRAGRKPRQGIRIHRSSTLLPSRTTLREAIPVTRPARTVSDLRRVLLPDHVNAAIRRAEILRLDIGPQQDYEPDRTRNELERAFRRLCRRHGLPQPELNVWIGEYEADFLWRDRRLIVETDGWETHGTPKAFENDRARDVKLSLLGYRVVRFTHRQVTREPDAVAAALMALLEARVPAGARRDGKPRRRPRAG